MYTFDCSSCSEYGSYTLAYSGPVPDLLSASVPSESVLSKSGCNELSRLNHINFVDVCRKGANIYAYQ